MLRSICTFFINRINLNNQCIQSTQQHASPTYHTLVSRTVLRYQGP